MLLCTQEEYSQVFDDDKRELMKMTGLMTWTIVCTLKKIHRWLRSAETERKSSKGYLRSSELRQSKSSKSSRKSQSSLAWELKEKARMTELMVQAEYTEQRQLVENQAEM